MDGRHIILVFLLQSHKRVRVLDAIHKVAPALNHALVNQFLERLFLARHTHVEEELVPEAAVNQMTRSMFATAHIQIDILPILVSLLAHQSLVVVWVHIAQIVSRTARKTWHGVEFDREHRLVVNLRVLHNLLVHLVPSPHRSIAQWGFTCLRRQELIHLRQLNGQALLWNHRRDAILVIHRERLTPITLTREDGISQAIVHLHTAYTSLLHILLRGSNSLLHRQSVEAEINVRLHILTGRVRHNTLLSIVTFLTHVSPLNQRNNRQAEMLGKRIVAAVMCRHSHDSPRAISSQHIF